MPREETYPPSPALVRHRTRKLSAVPVVRRTKSQILFTRSQDVRIKLGMLLDEPYSSRAASALFVVVLLAIFLSVASFYLMTVENLIANDQDDVFRWIEGTCVLIFTAEVFARTLVATLDLKRMLLLDIYWWIDALAIVPFYARLAYDMGRGDCIAAATANVSATNLTLVRELVDATCASELPIFLKFLQLLRLLRILKLMRHYVDVRVLMIALGTAWRALLVPAFAMLLTILILSGGLWLAELDPNHEDAFDNALEALWCVFWIVSTLGFDGSMGTGGSLGQVIIAIAIIAGLILTTMPITMIGEAFHTAWQRKEVLILEMRVQDLLVKRGFTLDAFKTLFDELDTDGSGELDWAEFKVMLEMLSIRLPVQKMRFLFESLDHDRAGTVSFDEMCKALFPKQDWEKVQADSLLFEDAIINIQAHARGYLDRLQLKIITEGTGAPAPTAASLLQAFRAPSSSLLGSTKGNGNAITVSKRESSRRLRRCGSGGGSSGSPGAAAEDGGEQEQPSSPKGGDGGGGEEDEVAALSPAPSSSPASSPMKRAVGASRQEARLDALERMMAKCLEACELMLVKQSEQAAALQGVVSSSRHASSGSPEKRQGSMTRQRTVEEIKADIITRQATAGITRQATGSLARQATGSLARQPTGSLARQATGSLARQPTGSLARQGTASGLGTSSAARAIDVTPAQITVKPVRSSSSILSLVSGGSRRARMAHAPAAQRQSKSEVSSTLPSVDDP